MPKALGLEFEDTPEGYMIAAAHVESLGFYSDAADLRAYARELRLKELLRGIAGLLLAGAALVFAYFHLPTS